VTGDIYGRGQAEWDQLARNGLAFLVERARLGRPTSYTEFNSTSRAAQASASSISNGQTSAPPWATCSA
jgi:hypothetical protein